MSQLALDCVHKEYPNVILHYLNDNSDVQTPSQLHPAFYGCFDWHSSVHGHWLLARLAKLYPEHQSSQSARKALDQSLSTIKLESELTYVSAHGRGSFERPYGWAWLLQLVAELDTWKDDQAGVWRENLKGLEKHGVQVFENWLPKLTFPVRSGTHGQTAFALGLVFDYATTVGNKRLQKLIKRRAFDLYGEDKNCPLTYEPSGHDFLSACISEADLMRRIMPTEDYALWLTEFLPGINDPLSPASVSDPTDGHLVHLDGLNLSRAWMLEGILEALPPGDIRRAGLVTNIKAHRKIGLASILDPSYAGGHWLGSFATYLVTRRGLGY